MLKMFLLPHKVALEVNHRIPRCPVSANQNARFILKTTHHRYSDWLLLKHDQWFITHNWAVENIFELFELLFLINNNGGDLSYLDIYNILKHNPS